jgi:hypothetical protein
MKIVEKKLVELLLALREARWASSFQLELKKRRRSSRRKGRNKNLVELLSVPREV